MAAMDALARGRTAFDSASWAEAYAQLLAADRRSPLDPEDLDRLATAAYLVGEDAASADARSRAHVGFLERSQPLRAARSAFWLAFAILDNPHQRAQAGGWLARARGLLDGRADECAEQGFLRCASAFQAIGSGQIEAARAGFAQAAAIGRRFKEPDLIALARHGEGRLLARLGRAAEGLDILDEVMVSVTCGEVAPMVAGVIYCSVIGACYEQFDLRRAQEWTTALTDWCARHPDMVPFRGQCLIRRSELLELHGAWQDAADEAARACRFLTDPPDQPDAGSAHYQAAELHRLRGEPDAAEAAYRRASQAGRDPQPGLALLRLASGQLDVAQSAIRLAIEQTRGIRARPLVLRAGVEVLLAAGDLPGAQAAADELARTADERDAPFLRAAAAQAAGAMALAAGEARAGVDRLREAVTIWRDLDAPYEAARVRALLGRAHRLLGDEEGAQLEFEAAADVFDRLGALTDAAALVPLTGATPPSSGALTGREVEVLRLVATGKTNRAIAADLSISEKTVARHLSNIFTKLDLSSRSAATAYAYDHKLL